MRSPILLKVAYLGWGLPLLLASLGLLAYWRTRARMLLDSGLILLVVGFVLALVGIACASVFLVRNRGAIEPGGSRARRSGLVAIGLLALNFPIAWLYVLIGTFLGDQIYLRIVNGGPRRLDQVAVLSPHNRMDVGPLNPGQEAAIYFNPRGQTGMEIRVRRGPEVRTAEITGYAMGFGADDSRVVISGDLRITVQPLRTR